MSDEIFFKNPNRNRVTKKQDPTTEYQRLNIEPTKIQKDKSFDSTARRLAEVRRLEEEANARINQSSSGNKLISVGETYPGQFGREDDSILEEKSYNEDIDADSINVPQNNDPFQNDQEAFSFHDNVDIGDYILLYKDQIIEVGNEESLIETLSSIINKDDDFKVEDFAVLKKVKLNIGIFIKD